MGQAQPSRNNKSRTQFRSRMYNVSDDEQIDHEEFTKMITAMYKLNGVAVDDGDNNPITRATEIIASLGIDEDKKID
ncbi:unnamed protein product [Rotaria sp. Silwood1]|nr:unnamed protein product [Rotaria sp. Silwood1]CAF1618651.1 unnamed protein product [Rotaria sp. Silwood1]CAF3733301.1 unnamed protein product [Rotaria sp. Silwood1]CAF3813237.1 unnamed protein product [Rotaria sp. Silwood1]CAF4826260.1 unnamed protein product [Rotaria sp. Silwood1]